MAGTTRRWRRLRRAAWTLLGVAVATIATPNLWILASTVRQVQPLDTAPARPWVIVLGASVRRDGRPSRTVAERLDTVVDLVERGRVDSVLVTGDRDAARDYDEVGIMARYLRDRGVPDTAIRIDPHGHRTLDSMWRARHVFGLRSALVVSNGFHVPRAVWLGSQFGIDCVGVPARDEGHSLRYHANNQLREAAARVIAVFDVLCDRQPRERGD